MSSVRDRMVNLQCLKVQVVVKPTVKTGSSR